MKTHLTLLLLFILWNFSAQAQNVNDEITVKYRSSYSDVLISFPVKTQGSVLVKAYSLEGKQVAYIKNDLEIGEFTYSIKLPKGLYLIHVVGKGFTYSTKLISNSISNDKSITLYNNQEIFSVNNTRKNITTQGKIKNNQNKKRPTVTTEIKSITSNSALFIGNVLSEGSAPVTSKGFAWGREKASLDLYPESKESGMGAFEKQVTNLSHGTIYYVRAFAKNKYGYSFGNTIAFRAIQKGDFYQGGNLFHLEENGIKGYVAIAEPYKYVQKKAWQPEPADIYIGTNSSIGSGASNTQSIVSKFPDFDGAAQYCYNLEAHGYDDWFLPSIDELYILFCSIGGPSGWYASSSEGNSYYIMSYPHIPTGLNAKKERNTARYIGIGVNYSRRKSEYLSVYPIRSFPLIPKVETLPVVKISNSYAESGYKIINNDDTTLINAGLCWSTSPNPTIKDHIMTSPIRMNDHYPVWQINNLQPNTTYYLRAFATNRTGTAYGNQQIFTTQPFNYSIGQTYQGGIIGHIFLPGEKGYVPGEKHGIIVHKRSYTAAWGCESYPTNPTGLGFGRENTERIIRIACSEFPEYAAKICSELNVNGFDDWFLPSADEYEIIFSNLGLQSDNLGYFNLSTEYWTSSSDPINGTWYYSGKHKYQNKGLADSLLEVRPIRLF